MHTIYNYMVSVRLHVDAGQLHEEITGPTRGRTPAFRGASRPRRPVVKTAFRTHMQRSNHMPTAFEIQRLRYTYTRLQLHTFTTTCKMINMQLHGKYTTACRCCAITCAERKSHARQDARISTSIASTPSCSNMLQRARNYDTATRYKTAFQV